MWQYIVRIILQITVAMVVFSVEIHGGRSKLPKVCAREVIEAPKTLMLTLTNQLPSIRHEVRKVAVQPPLPHEKPQVTLG